MILKIKDFNGEWWIYSELEKIHYSYIERNLNTEDSNVWEKIIQDIKTDSFINLTPDSKELPDRYLKLITRTKYDKEVFMFLESCTCYLCNDEGKTIDKIVS